MAGFYTTPRGKLALSNHPGVSPYRGQAGRAGRFWGKSLKTGALIRADAGRWRPHTGAKERAKYATAAPHRLGGSA